MTLSQERLEAIRRRAEKLNDEPIELNRELYHAVMEARQDIPDLLAEVERLRNEINFIANVDLSRAYDAEHVAVSVKSWALNVLEGVDSE